METFKDFLSHNDYDVRKTGDARWIDQKCTYDVVSIIADCIIQYANETASKEFTVSDIWHSDYAKEHVTAIFSKPDPKFKACNEYDKYFGQPIKLLAYSKILNVRKENNRRYYSINNKELLGRIALRPMNALNFLYEYICKVLSDSGLMDTFEEFFSLQDKNSYKKVRDTFIDFTISNTKINGATECGRIFTKVINPLAFKLKKRGTKKGRISKDIITLSDLQYNRINWRDELSGKAKSMTRTEHIAQLSKQKNAIAYADYTINKAKKAVRNYNDMVYGGASEIIQSTETVCATQAHHIFSQSDYPQIADFLENLIMLTPNQHFSMAHPNNNTQYIDKDFQYICLIAKSTKIYDNLTSSMAQQIYDFDAYKTVLNTGLSTEEFSSIGYLDFAQILDKIDYFYSDVLANNKYSDLIKDNRLVP